MPVSVGEMSPYYPPAAKYEFKRFLPKYGGAKLGPSQSTSSESSKGIGRPASTLPTTTASSSTLNTNQPIPDDPIISPQQGPISLFLLPSSARLPTTQPSSEIRSRTTRATSLRASRMPLVTLAGLLPLADFPFNVSLRPLRARKVRCNRLPGQDKVHLPLSHFSRPSQSPKNPPVPGNSSS